MSAEMTIPAAIHRAKGTLNEPSSIMGRSVAQRTVQVARSIGQRNTLAKAVMQDIEAQRKQRRKGAR